MGYRDRQAAIAAGHQADKYKAEAQRLQGAIVAHFKEIHKHNWGADDDLWAAIGLVADPEVVG
jgi:hypothetical protein